MDMMTTRKRLMTRTYITWKSEIVADKDRNGMILPTSWELCLRALGSWLRAKCKASHKVYRLLHVASIARWASGPYRRFCVCDMR